MPRDHSHVLMSLVRPWGKKLVAADQPDKKLNYSFLKLKNECAWPRRPFTVWNSILLRNCIERWTGCREGFSKKWVCVEPGFPSTSFSLEMQSLDKWETISVLMTQNVFGNNSRRKLDFKVGVVGEAFNQVRVNGLPAKFELFNQEGWSQRWHFLRYRTKWPWPIFGDHATMTIFAVSQKWPWPVLAIMIAKMTIFRGIAKNGHGHFLAITQQWPFLRYRKNGHGQLLTINPLD